jgi:hypothetical protein
MICDSMITESAMFDVAARRILKLATPDTLSTKTAFIDCRCNEALEQVKHKS